MSSVCEQCGIEYVATASHQRFCSTRCNWRACDDRRRAMPSYVAWNRERCKMYRGSSGAQPWLLGAPAFGPYLPGGACSITLSRSVPLHDLRHLHGALTVAIGEKHDTTIPGFALMPWCNGWAAYLHSEAACAIAGTTRVIRLGGESATMTTGSLARLRTPKIARRGRQRVRIDAITPVVIRSMAGKTSRTAPTASNLQSSLAITMASRLGFNMPPESVCIEIVECDTLPETVGGLGKFGGDGRIRGFVGSMVVECNAVSRWLLECAGRGMGLGGRTALGFGRVRVTPCE
jgi:hypothetical protein